MVKLSDQIFKIDPSIRYVAVLNKNHELVESRQRPGVRSLTQEKTDEEFSSIIPTIILGASENENATKYLGRVHRVTIRYDKLSIIIFKKADHVVVVTAKPRMIPQVVPKIEKFIQGRGKI